MKVIVDSNVVISSFEHDESKKIVDMAAKGVIVPVVSKDLLREYSLVPAKMIIQRLQDKYQEGILKDIDFYYAGKSLYNNLDEVYNRVLSNAEFKEIKRCKQISPHSEDDRIINLAMENECEFIITRNMKHFKCVENKGITTTNGIPIKPMYPNQFLEYFIDNEKAFIVTKELERRKIIEQYPEFAASKHWNEYDIGHINKANELIGRITPVTGIVVAQREVQLQMRRLNEKLKEFDKQTNVLKKIEPDIKRYDGLTALTNEYLNSSLLSRPCTKVECLEASKEREKILKRLATYGIQDRSDYDRLCIVNQVRIDEVRPGIMVQLEAVKQKLDILSRAVGSINKAIQKEMMKKQSSKQVFER